MKEPHLEVEGHITQVHNSEHYRVELIHGPIVLAHRTGRLRHRSPTIGDRVLVALSPYDLEKGIIRKILPVEKL